MTVTKQESNDGTVRAQPARRLAILGTRGIPACHGGFETFAEQVSRYLVAHGWSVTVYCQADRQSEVGESEWEGVRLVRIAAFGEGPVDTMWFDWCATWRAAREGGLVLTLGYNTAVFLLWLRLRGVTNLINMDGVEWRRSKWGPLARSWLYLNERMAPWFADHLIADNPHIASHLERHTRGERITMIPYGAPAVTEADASLLQPYGLQPGGYVLVVARPEPENSILDMVRAFTARPRGVDLVILGNYYPHLVPYHRLVTEHAARHPEVRMLGGVYETEVVRSLRTHAQLYLHGHQVGGTNPSLVEALGAGSACLVRDNPFNRWVAGPAALYFRDEVDCLGALDQLLHNQERLQALRVGARKRHRERFGLEAVLAEYENLLAAWHDARVHRADGVMQGVPRSNEA
jgi:glycosyltransferase involved in cell wall biosynthesis